MFPLMGGVDLGMEAGWIGRLTKGQRDMAMEICPPPSLSPDHVAIRNPLATLPTSAVRNALQTSLVLGKTLCATTKK